MEELRESKEEKEEEEHGGAQKGDIVLFLKVECPLILLHYDCRHGYVG